jgi:hypothetical protein
MTTHESFQQSLVEIGSQPNFAEMILGWSPFKNVSISAVLYPRWPPLLKIEIFQQSLVEIGSVVSDEKIFF